MTGMRRGRLARGAARRASAGRAALWLRDLRPASRDQAALIELGLELADRVRSRKGAPIDRDAARAALLPGLDQLLDLPRSDLYAALQRVSCREARAFDADGDEIRAWCHHVGLLAVSHAKTDDPLMAAALTRVAATLHPALPELREVEGYLVERQREAGSFAPLASLDEEGDPSVLQETLLRLTIEALWAFAALARRTEAGAARAPSIESSA